jgi:hypothetical protein
LAVRALRAPPSECGLMNTLEDGLADDRAQALRERVTIEIPQRLTENGLRLSIHHQLDANVAGLGFATATEMAAELGAGAHRLFAAELWYPGAALVRQLIECTYLLALMAERRDEAEEWMTSSHDDIVARFQPRHLRNRSVRNFRSAEYQTHCDYGGHPNPVGRALLRHHDDWRPLPVRAYWLDLAQHVADTWNSFTSALPSYDPRMDPADPLHSPHRSPDGAADIARLLTQWHELDPLAQRFPLPGRVENES